MVQVELLEMEAKGERKQPLGTVGVGMETEGVEGPQMLRSSMGRIQGYRWEARATERAGGRAFGQVRWGEISGRQGSCPQCCRQERS